MSRALETYVEERKKGGQLDDLIDGYLRKNYKEINEDVVLKEIAERQNAGGKTPDREADKKSAGERTNDVKILQSTCFGDAASVFYTLQNGLTMAEMFRRFEKSEYQ